MPPISGAMLTFIGYAPDFTFLNSQLRNPVVNKKDEVKVWFSLICIGALVSFDALTLLFGLLEGRQEYVQQAASLNRARQ